MKFKKAQGISINTIIIAAIALIVLVVIVMIFTGRIGQFGKAVASCGARGGVCLANDNACRDALESGYKYLSKDGKIITFAQTTQPDDRGSNVGCSGTQVCCIGIKRQTV